jgi:hypothetical protein
MNNNEKNIIIKPITDLLIEYPRKPETMSDKEHHGIINNLDRNVCIVPNNEVAVKKQGISKILSTDIKGARRFINNLSNNELIYNGNDTYVKLPSLQKEITNRIQQPRDVLTKEKLKFTEESLRTIRDNPELEKARGIAFQRIQNELPRLRDKKIKAENISKDDITGEPLKQNAVAHHIERKSDNPNIALNLDNIAILNRATHIEGHQNNFEGPENYRKFRETKQKNI